MTCGEVVVVVGVRVQNLDDGPATITCRCHREFQQIVCEQDALAGRDRGMESPHDRVQILNRRLEAEGRLIIRVEPPAESSIRPERVMREDDAIRQTVRPPVPEQTFDDVERASELVWKHGDNARRVQRRHARTVATQLSEGFLKGDCTSGERHGSGVSARTSNTKPAAFSRSKIAPVFRFSAFDSWTSTHIARTLQRRSRQSLRTDSSAPSISSFNKSTGSSSQLRNRTDGTGITGP